MLSVVLRLLLTAFLCVLLVGFGLCGVVVSAQGLDGANVLFMLMLFALACLLTWAIVRLWVKRDPPPPLPPPDA